MKCKWSTRKFPNSRRWINANRFNCLNFELKLMCGTQFVHNYHRKLIISVDWRSTFCCFPFLFSIVLCNVCAAVAPNCQTARLFLSFFVLSFLFLCFSFLRWKTRSDSNIEWMQKIHLSWYWILNEKCFPFYRNSNWITKQSTNVSMWILNIKSFLIQLLHWKVARSKRGTGA